MSLTQTNYSYTCDLQTNQTVQCDGQLCSVLLSILMILLIIVTVIGNGCVMYIIYRKSVLHSVTGIMMFNLAVTDLLVGLMNMPFSLAAFVANGWEFGIVVCKMVAFIHTQMSTASVVWLAIISIDRCCAICKPFKYNFIFTTSKVKGIIIIGYLISVVVALPPLFEYKSWGRYRYLGKMAFCWVSDCKARQYLISLMSFLASSFIVIVICHVLIYRSAKSNCRRIPRLTTNNRDQQQSYSTPLRTLVPWLSTTTPQQNYPTFKRFDSIEKDKINKTTLIIVGTFFICWAPRTIIGILQLLTPNLDNYGIIELLCLWLSMTNSTLNPIIYGFHNKVFRQEFQRAFYRHPGRRIQPILMPTSNRPSFQSFHRATSN